MISSIPEYHLIAFIATITFHTPYYLLHRGTDPPLI